MDINHLQQQLENAKQEANRSPSKELADAYNKLKSDLEKRETKIQSLTTVIQQLKTSLMEAAKESAENKIKEENLTLKVQQSIDSQTLELNRQVKTLEMKLSKLTATCTKKEKECSELQVQFETIRVELESKSNQVQKQSEIITRLIHEAKTKLKATQDTEDSDFKWIDDIISSMDSANLNALNKAEKWETEKKLSKKVESLKSKLALKTKDVIESEKLITSLRSTLDRIERDRTRLQNKCQILSKTPEQQVIQQQQEQQNLKEMEFIKSQEATLAKIIQLESHIKDLENQNHTYESELNASKSDSSHQEQLIQQLNEKMQLLNDLNSRLQDRVTGYEMISLAQKQESIEQEKQEFEIKEKVCFRDLQVKILELSDKCHLLEREKVQLESKLLELRFENQEFLLAAKKNKNPTPSHMSPSVKKEEGDIPKQFQGKSIHQIIQTVDQLTRIVEKLKMENESFKKNELNHVKYQEALRDIKQLKKQLDQSLDEQKNVAHYVKQSAR